MACSVSEYGNTGDRERGVRGHHPSECGVRENRASVRIGRPMTKCELTITSLTSVFRSDPPSQDQSELRRVSLVGNKYVKTPGIVSAHTKVLPPGLSFGS